MNETRRPLKTRSTKWAGMVATWCHRAGLTPNTISCLSCLFALIAGISLWQSKHFPGSTYIILMLTSAAGIQLRLLCNMIDGMVAVEGGLKTKTGDLFNEVPDRISDTIIFVGAAYSSAFPHLLELGWGAAVLAILTAYVRAMGVTLGVGQMFHGPMAKPHRMATLTIACLLSTTVSFLPQMAYIIPTALIVICVGSIVTTVRRLNAITNKLHQ